MRSLLPGGVELLDDSVYTSVSEIGDAENISKSYVSGILRLTLLAPDAIEAILAGRADQALLLESLERPLPAGWEEQRESLCADPARPLVIHDAPPRGRRSAQRSRTKSSPRSPFG